MPKDKFFVPVLVVVSVVLNFGVLFADDYIFK